jgi:hypothetical protein
VAVARDNHKPDRQIAVTRHWQRHGAEVEEIDKFETIWIWAGAVLIYRPAPLLAGAPCGSLDRQASRLDQWSRVCVQASRPALDRGRQRCGVLDQLLDVGVGNPMQAVVRFVRGHEKPYFMSCAVWDKPAEALL